MNWHYADGNATKGPIPEGAFVALVRAGRVQPTTLVWHEGMAEWIPLNEAAPELLSAAAAPLPDDLDKARPEDDRITCIECGREFTRSECVGLPGGWVCAACKPLRVQKLKEGAVAAAEARHRVGVYAGFWIRFAAKFVDGMIWGLVLGGLFFLVMMLSLEAGQIQEESFFVLYLLFYPAAFAFVIGYNTLFVGRFGATPGKMACGIRVVAPDGSKITYARALGRAGAELLSRMICDIGYIIAAFDEQKRALHDHIASTRVVYGPRF